MNFKLLIICLFLLSVFSVNAQPNTSSIEVTFYTEKYNYYYSINLVRDALEDTILFYNEADKKILKVTEFIKSRDMTYVNLGNNQIEGTFKGFVDKNHAHLLTVTYKKISSLELTTSDRTFEYTINNRKKIVVPVQFNRDPKEVSFTSKQLALFEKGKNKFIDYFDVEYADHRFRVDSDLNKTKAGSYTGNLIFKEGGKELKQPIEVNIKHSFLTAMIAFILSFALSYLVRYFSINEEEVNAYVRAKKLLDIVQKDDQIVPEAKEALLNKIENHISEIEAWLHQASYYENKFNDLLKEYSVIDRINAIEAISPLHVFDFVASLSRIEKIKYGVKFSHTLITFLLCLVAFNAIYCDDQTFGANIILDYLKLFAAVLAIVIASKGLIKERITSLKITKG